MSFKLTKRQTTAYDLAVNGVKKVIVFGGAIRGGKTYWLLLTLSSLCLLYPRSRWVIIRKTLPDLKRTTFPSFSSILNDGLNQYISSWNRETNAWALTHWSWADIMVGAKGKNLASQQLYEQSLAQTASETDHTSLLLA
jgi:hypothetical protein